MLPVDERSFGGRYNEDSPWAGGFPVELAQLNSKNCGISETAPGPRAACAGLEGGPWLVLWGRGVVLSS